MKDIKSSNEKEPFVLCLFVSPSRKLLGRLHEGRLIPASARDRKLSERLFSYSPSTLARATNNKRALDARAGVEEDVQSTNQPRRFANHAPKRAHGVDDEALVRERQGGAGWGLQDVHEEHAGVRDDGSDCSARGRGRLWISDQLCLGGEQPWRT